MTSPIVDVEINEGRWYVEIVITRLDGGVETVVYGAGYGDGIDGPYVSVEEWEDAQ